jgi:type II secretory pathway pseudopilin PulG
VVAERTSLDDETGWTLMELLVATTLLLIALTAVGSTLVVGLGIGKREVERPTALGEAQTGLTRMQRELGQAYQMLFANGTVLDVLVYLPNPGGGRRNVRLMYTCDAGSATVNGLRQCTRYEKPVATPPSPSDIANPGALTAGSTGTTVIDRVQNGTASAPVFTNGSGSAASYSGVGAAPTYVGVVIKVPQKGEAANGNKASFILSGALYFRNLDAKTAGP